MKQKLTDKLSTNCHKEISVVLADKDEYRR